MCHTGFLISTWTLDRDQYCRHLGKEELFIRIITHLGVRLRLTERWARSPSRIQASLLCSASGSCTPMGPFASETLCSQPCDPRGCQVRAVSQCLSLMKGFNHTAWPERHMLISVMAHYCPGPQTQQHSWHCPATSRGDTAAFCPRTAGNSSGRKGHPVTAWAPWAWPEKAPSVLTGKAGQNNQHMAGLLLLRLQTGTWLPGRPPANGNLGPKPKGTDRCCS